MTEKKNINCSFLGKEDLDFETAFNKVAPLIFSLTVLLVIAVIIIIYLVVKIKKNKRHDYSHNHGCRFGGGDDNQHALEDTVEINLGDCPNEEDGAEEL